MIRYKFPRHPELVQDLIFPPRKIRMLKQVQHYSGVLLRRRVLLAATALLLSFPASSASADVKSATFPTIVGAGKLIDVSSNVLTGQCIIKRQGFAKAVNMGVKLAYGTDSGVYPHGGNAKQFAYMFRYGMPPMQAIQSATIRAAELLGKEGESELSSRGILLIWSR